MNTKSAIQIITEVATAKCLFFEHLAELSEKYNIVDNVFACDANGNAEELKEGYYGEVATYDTLDEARENCNVLLQAVRIHNDKVSVGNLYRDLSTVKEDIVIDLSKSQIL